MVFATTGLALTDAARERSLLPTTLAQPVLELHTTELQPTKLDFKFLEKDDVKELRHGALHEDDASRNPYSGISCGKP